MAVSLDADVGQIFKNLLKGKNTPSRKNSGEVQETPSLSKLYYRQAAVKSVIIICVTAIILMAISYFTASSNSREESEFNSAEELQTAVAKIEQDTISGASMLVSNRKKVEETLPMFSDIEGSKALFKLISNIAASNSIIINSLSQGEVTETTNPAQYLQTKILLEMEGYFSNYLNFLQELNRQKPLLHIDSENVKLVIMQSGDRKLKITLNLTDYSVNKEEYEKILHN